MRLTLIGMLAATAALCTACSPAVGSPEWCKNMQAKMQTLDALSKLTPEEQQGLSQCVMNAINGMQ
jgi:hypothetical protein